MKKIMLNTLAALGVLLCFASASVEAGHCHRCCGPRVQVGISHTFGVSRDAYAVRRYARPVAPVVYVQDHVYAAPVYAPTAPVYVYQAPVYVEDVYVTPVRRPSVFTGLSFNWFFR